MPTSTSRAPSVPHGNGYSTPKAIDQHRTPDSTGQKGRLDAVSAIRNFTEASCCWFERQRFSRRFGLTRTSAESVVRNYHHPTPVILRIQVLDAVAYR